MTDSWTLKKNNFKPRKGPVLTVVLDGIGMGKEDQGNAIYHAKTPTLDRLLKDYPNRQLAAHGKAVGLPSDGDMGNSEVGHNAIGAGRVFAQGAKLVEDAIESKNLFDSALWQKLLERVKNNVGAKLHFMGLLSDGNVHSHIDHLEAMIENAAESDVKEICLHILLDGRDVGPQTSIDYIDRIEAFIEPFNQKGHYFRIASGGGRMYLTMDRYEADWSMVERGWKTHVLGKGKSFTSAKEAVAAYRKENPAVSDQFIGEFVIEKNGKPSGPIEDGDSVIFFNFRGDRAIEISKAFDDDNFPFFDRERRPNVLYAGMMQYDGDLAIPKHFLVEPPSIERTMGEYIAKNGMRQFACAETQKFGHVTYFWNGNRSGKFDDSLEDYVECPSDNVPFEERPWMKAAEVTDATIDALRSNQYSFLRINYANGDMVGHTGDFQAAVIAVEIVDLCLGRLLKVVDEIGGIALITADHGNSDEMYEWDKKNKNWALDEKGAYKAKTSHTLNPVPFVIYDSKKKNKEYQLNNRIDGGLANIAATVLELMGFTPPEDYQPSLITILK